MTSREHEHAVAKLQQDAQGFENKATVLAQQLAAKEDELQVVKVPTDLHASPTPCALATLATNVLGWLL